MTLFLYLHTHLEHVRPLPESLFFSSHAGATGTTTTGADLSPVIPSQEWSKIITEHLGLSVADPQNNFPLFLVDSEGMGIRGDAFDFITTSPPAIIAKSIIWIG